MAEIDSRLRPQERSNEGINGARDERRTWPDLWTFSCLAVGLARVNQTVRFLKRQARLQGLEAQPVKAHEEKRYR